jgi:GTP-binding protein
MNILSAKYIISSPDVESCPPADLPEYAFIGRSNVGKSSLINMLCNHQKLAKTSSSPGKTQMINHFTIKSAPEKNNLKPGDYSEWYLVDLPGYGFAKVSQSQRKSWAKMIENYLVKRENLINVFVLIDSRHTPQKIDIEFVNQLAKWKIPLSLVFTKADKTTQKEANNNAKEFLNELRKTWQFLPQHFITSAEKKLGRKQVLDFIDQCNTEIEQQQKEDEQN